MSYIGVKSHQILWIQRKAMLITSKLIRYLKFLNVSLVFLHLRISLIFGIPPSSVGINKH